MKRWIRVIGSVLLLVCLACSFGTGTGDENPPDRTTVLKALNLFVDVWNSGDIYTYLVLLDEQDFTFHFDPSDVGGEYDIPSSWGYEDETEAFTSIFSEVGTTNVDVQLDLSEVTEPEEDADTCSLHDISYLMYVYLPNLDDVLKAEGRLDLELEKRDGGWVVTDWSDFSNMRLPGIYETSWGGIKAYFVGDRDE